MQTVLIGGGSGLIGTRLSQMLRDRNYEVRHLSRRPSSKGPFPVFQWDPTAGQLDPNTLKDLDYVINLAGAGIADKRWSSSRKKTIIESRVQSTRLLKEHLKREQIPLQAFLSASAIGYYGDRGEEVLTEKSAPGEGFLPESTLAWEEAVFGGEPEVRTVAIRIGIVLSSKGGALEKLMLPSRFGLGTYFGNGRQWYSWIHIEDLCQLFIFAMENQGMQGIYNGVAPNPVRNVELVKALRKTMGGPGISLPVPEFLLRIPMGEMADVVFDGARVSSQKTEEAGFEFAFPELVPALQDIIGNRK